MSLTLDDIRWDGLFPSQPHHTDPAQYAALHAGRTVLVTGAGGSIGSALARSIAHHGPRRLLLVDSSEQNLYYIHRELASQDDSVVPALASVADETAMRDLFARFRPQVLYHAAALKHVPLGEMNPFAVVQTNVFGTTVVANLAREFRSERFIMISTDKSVNPESIMGACKRLAELVLLAQPEGLPRSTSIRLGNVLGSEGSVVPLFLSQIARGGPVTVTDPEVERYFLTMEQTVQRIFAAVAGCPSQPQVAVPVMGAPVRIVDLAKFLIAQAGRPEVTIAFTGLRPGDKMQEAFVAPDERVVSESAEGLRWLECPKVSTADVVTGLVALDEAAQARDLVRLLAVLTRLVPSYHPSAFLREQAHMAEAR